MKETTVSVTGVKCGGCVAKCEAALKTVPGFVEAAFDIPAMTAVIRGDVDVATAIAALGKAGYPAVHKAP
jgi:copper chaperone CopZ